MLLASFLWFNLEGIQDTQFCKKYFSSLILLGDSLTWCDLSADLALGWRFDCQTSEVPCNSNCKILWCHLKMRFFAVIVLSRRLDWLPSLPHCMYQGYKHPSTNVDSSYYHVLCKFCFFLYYPNEEFCFKWISWFSPWLEQI